MCAKTNCCSTRCWGSWRSSAKGAILGDFGRRAAANLQGALPGVRFLGAACWLAWILLIYSTELFDHCGDVHFYNALSYFSSTMAITATYLMAGFRSAFMYGRVRRNSFVAAAGVLASAGTALVVWGSYLDGPLYAVGVVGNVMTGLGTGVVSLRCATCCGDLSARRAAIVSFSVGALGMLMYSAAMSFPREASVVVTALLPIAAALIAMVEDGADASARGNGFGRLNKNFWRFIAVVFLLSFSLTISRGLYPNALQLGQFDESRELVALASTMFCLVMTIMFCLLPKQAKFGQVAYWFMFLTALVLLAFPFMGMLDPGVGVAHSTAFILLGIISWSILGGVSSITGLPVLQVFGFGFCTYLSGSMIGWPVGQLLSTNEEVLSSDTLSIALVLLVLVGFIAILRKDDFVELLQSNDEGETEFSVSCGISALVSPAEEGPKKMRWRIAISQIAAEGKLTPREESVLEMLAKTGDAHYIADTLGISYNTARTHVRNIYAKLDVHSHSELVAMVEDVRGQGAADGQAQGTGRVGA